MTDQQMSTIDLQQAVRMASPKAIELWLDVVPDPCERVRELAVLSKAALRDLGELLDAGTGIELLESIDGELAARILRRMQPARAATIIEALDCDDAAEVLREISEPARETILAQVRLTHADTLRELLSWPKDSVAARMAPEALLVAPTMTAAQAIAAVRDSAAALRVGSRTGAYVYVIDDAHRLLGVVAFRLLVLADPGASVSELMNDDLVWVSPLTDAELAAQKLSDYHLVALPVVDADRRLLGIITEDDAAEIAEDGATEDAERQGGSAPLEVPYLRASPWLLWRKRIVWLLVLFAAEAYTGTVLRWFEEELEAVVALAFFIPLLIGTGGNTGTQITTTLVRALATGQVRFRDLPAILTKELSTGVLLGLSMALAAVIRAWTLGVGPEVTITVALTVAAIVVWSSLVASVLPLALAKLRVDPALVSAPMIATVVDGTGLIIYFMIAHATLSQLQGL